MKMYDIIYARFWYGNSLVFPLDGNTEAVTFCRQRSSFKIILKAVDTIGNYSK